jgi:hypothetical protein
MHVLLGFELLIAQGTLEVGFVLGKLEIEDCVGSIWLNCEVSEGKRVELVVDDNRGDGNCMPGNWKDEDADA